MADLTEKYLDKELVNSIPEVLPPDYDKWLDKMEPTITDFEGMAKIYMGVDLAQGSVDCTITVTVKNGQLVYIYDTTKPVF